MDERTLFHTVWLLTSDRQFLHRFRNSDASAFPRGPLTYLVTLAIDQYNKHRKPLTEATVDLAVETDAPGLKRHRTTAHIVRQVFKDLDRFAIDDDGIENAREVCGDWFRRQNIQARMEQVSDTLKKGTVEEAVALFSFNNGDEREAPLDMVVASSALIAGAHCKQRHKDATPTGFQDLDRAWRGGYRPGEIGIVAASTGIGKSQLLCQITCEAFWKGRQVLYYTFELTKWQIGERILMAASSGASTTSGARTLSMNGPVPCVSGGSPR